MVKSSFGGHMFGNEKEKPMSIRHFEQVSKTIDVKFEITSDSYEWKQGWWIDGFIF